jgi:hypothetical protein
MMRLLHTIRDQLFRPVDIASMALFRIAFGLLMVWDTSRYILFGWVGTHYIDPPLLFKFIGFQWVGTLPDWGMYAVHVVMIAAGLSIAAGWHYRLSCLIYALGHTYLFLVAASYYLNHGYLISVFTALMALVPAHHALSVDAWRNPALRRTRIHAWPFWMLLGLFTVVYVFGAIAKMNGDWFAGVPVRQWMEHSATQVPVGGSILRSEAYIQFVVWAGMLFDLLIPAILLWRRTRPLGVATSIAFHLTNAYTFSIGVFPWFMLAATTLFFVPSYPRELEGLEDRLNRWIDHPPTRDGEPAHDTPKPLSAGQRRAIELGLAALLLLNLFLPLRHHLYPGDVTWTEEGHYFAWRMKLRDKRGRAHFRLSAPALDRHWTVDPGEQLSDRQLRKMIGKPDLLLQYAHYLRDAYQKELGSEVQVRADVWVSLNFRREQRFVDPEVDLGAQRASLAPYRWILPFERTPVPVPVDRLQPGMGQQATVVGRAIGARQRLLRLRSLGGGR